MIEKIKKIYFTETGRDSSIVFISTFINIVSGGLFFILVPRVLGPANYGIFAVIITTAALAASIANFGIDTGMLRFAKADAKNFNSIVTLAFKSYLILGFITAFIGFLVAPSLASILNYPQIAYLLRIAFFANILILLTNFYTAYLQAKKDFYKASLVNITGNVLRLGILLLALFFIKLGLFQITIIFFASIIFSVMFGYFASPFKLEVLPKNESLNFFKYNSWIALALIISSVPFDNYLLLKFAGPIEAGLYAAPFKILTFIYQFGGNFSRVMAPRFASFNNHQKAKIFSSKSIPFVIIGCFALLILIPLSPVIIPAFFSESYRHSVPVFQILTLGFTAFLASTIPSSIILYYLGKSKVSAYITFLKYTILVLMLVVLVPQYKAVGAAWAFTSSELISFLVMSTYAFLKLRD